MRPAKLWNDTESAPDVGWLVKKLGGAAAWAEAVGSVPVAALTITKLSWLHRTEPDAWSRMRHVCLPHDWLTWKLTGRLVTDRGDASGTGYWSPIEERYRFDLLEIVDSELDWRSMVPAVLGPADSAGIWTSGAGGPLVACGTGDNMAAALGTGLGVGEIVHVARHFGHRLRRERRGRRRTRPAPWPASPTPPAATCPSSAR